MTALPRALDRLQRLLKQERSALLAGAHRQLDGLAQQLEDALGAVESGMIRAADPRLADRLQEIRHLSEGNARLLQAASQGLRDAESLLATAKGAWHGTYAADGTILPHAGPSGRLHRKT